MEIRKGRHRGLLLHSLKIFACFAFLAVNYGRGSESLSYSSDSWQSPTKQQLLF